VAYSHVSVIISLGVDCLCAYVIAANKLTRVEFWLIRAKKHHPFAVPNLIARLN